MKSLSVDLYHPHFKSADYSLSIFHYLPPIDYTFMKYLFIMAASLLMVTACTDPLQEIENAILITQPQPGEGMEEERSEIICSFESIERQAKFPGGITAWENHLTQYLKQPTGACIEGKVFLAFRVKASGKITNIQVSRGITPEADQIAVNVLKASPDWIPGKTRDGKPIDSNMAIMIRFGLKH